MAIRELEDSETNRQSVVVLDQLGLSFGKVRAVKDISMSVKKNELVALLGHNGAGKTSTFKCLVGEESVSGGTVQVANTDQRRIYGRPWRLHGMIGYCPQYNCIDPYLTVK